MKQYNQDPGPREYRRQPERPSLAPRWCVVAAMLISLLTLSVSASAQWLYEGVTLNPPASSFQGDVLRDDGLALHNNPANLSYLRGAQFSIGVRAEQEPYGEAGYSVLGAYGTRFGLAFGASFNAQRFDDRFVSGVLGVAFGNEAFAFGLRYRVYGSNELPDIAGFNSTDLGLTLRPTNVFGLSFMVENAWEQTIGDLSVGRTYRAATAFRTNNGSFESEFGYRALVDSELIGEDLQSELYSTVRVRPTDGFHIFASGGFDPAYGDNPPYRVLGGVAFNYMGLTVETAVDYTAGEGSNSIGGSGWISYNSHPERTIAHPRNALYKVELSGQIAERPRRRLLGSDKPAFVDLLDSLYRVRDNDAYAGVYLHLSATRASHSQLWEIRQALDSIRDAGKEVIVYLERGGIRDLYLADSGTWVAASPAFVSMDSGIAAVRTYFGDLLERMGIEAQFVRIGEYKSATERFTEGGPSEQSSEALTAYVEDVWAELSSGLCRHRASEACEGETLRQPGPWTAIDLYSGGWLDALGYEHELPRMLRERAEGGSYRIVDSPTLLDWRSNRWRNQPVIAVLHITGDIVGGDSGNNPLTGGQFTGHQSIEAAVRELLEDSTVRGVILRVNSRGGSAWASDEIRAALQRLVDAEIPMVVSYGSAAASGGYYVSALGEEIIATPTGVVGSIGIYAGTFGLDNALGRAGINRDETARGGPSHLFNGQTWTPEEREWVERSVQFGYDRFVQLVAEAREMTTEEVDAVARGRIWSGQDAVDAGLADQVGSFEDARRALCAIADCGRGERLPLKHFGQASGLPIPDVIVGALGLEEQDALLSWARRSADALGVTATLNELLIAGSEEARSGMYGLAGDLRIEYR